MAQVKKEAFVWDFTFMNHLLRVHLDLSANEYIYMDMIARLANQHGGYTGLSNKSAAQAIGVSISTIKIFIDALTKKGLLESKDSCIGDCVPKRGTVLWWELYNKLLPKNENSTTPQSNLNRGSQNLTTPNQKQTTRKLKLPYRNKKVATIDNPIVSTIENTTFSEEKGSSEKTEVFSLSTEKKKIAANSNPKTGLFSQDENQTEKEKNCGKKEKAETPETEAKPTRTKFIKPTVEEIEAYCAENNFPVDANGFIDHYIANGWKVGNNPMKDWKATVRNWARKNFSNQNNNSKPNQNYKQNGTNQSTTKPNAQPDANTVARVLDRDRQLNELGY